MNRERVEQGIALRTLIHMDDPDHRVIRAIGADWFRPRAMRALEPRVRELAKRYVDRMVDLGGECDFAREVAVHFPLYVILSLLGLPESDFDRMLKLTQELFGGDDDELQRGTTNEEKLQVLLDFFAYFQGLTEARRKNPTDDLASAIANARRRRAAERLRHRVLLRHHRDGRARHDQRDDRRRPARPDRAPRPARPAPREARAAAAGRGRDDPLGHAGQGVHAHRERGLRAARHHDPERRRGAALLPVREQGRGRLRRPVPLRRRARPEQAPGVRVRRPLLPGRRAGPDRGPRLLRGAAAPAELDQAAGTPESIATTFVGGLKRLPVRYSIA